MENLFKDLCDRIEIEASNAIKKGIEEGIALALQKSKDSPKKEYLSRKEACKYLGGISLPTLDSLVKDHTIQSHRLGGRILFIQAELEQAIIKRDFK